MGEAPGAQPREAATAGDERRDGAVAGLSSYSTAGDGRPGGAAASWRGAAGEGRAEAPAVEVSNLRVVRGGKVVIPDLSLSVPAGSVTGLLGPSGCGKSTLMRAIVGVQKVAGGEVRVLGMAAGSKPLRRRVGYVTQSPSVYADLTVRENLAYFARLLNAAPADVAAAVETVGLGQQMDQTVGSMSGGQHNRASLAVALLGRPSLLVLDEPTVGLDPVLRRDLWRTFHELADRGATLLVSSHVMDEAAECDLLLLMRDGHLVASESPAELRRRTGREDLGEAFLNLIESEEVER